MSRRPCPRLEFLTRTEAVQRLVHQRGRRVLFIVFLFLVLAAALVVSRFAGHRLFLRWRPDPVWRQIMAERAWDVALDPTFPPFEDMTADGTLVGLDVDLARAIGAQWGVETRFVMLGYDGLIDAVRSGKADAAISAIPYNPLLTQDVRFSDPYFDAGWRVVVAATSPARAISELASARVAVEWGSEGHVWAKRLQREHPKMEIVLRLSPDQVIASVVSGEVEAGIVDGVTALQHADRVRVIASLSSEPYVIVLPYRAYRLQEEVNNALRTLRASGYLDALIAKWLHPARATPDSGG